LVLSFAAASVVAVVLASVAYVSFRTPSTVSTSTPDARSRSVPSNTPAEAAAFSPSTFEILGYTDGFGDRERRGYAFVIRSGAGKSFLLTDYDLLVGDFMEGYRTVDVRRGDQTFTATIIAVNPDPHVALLRIRGVFPALPISPVRLRPGVTVTVGEPSSAAAQPAAVLDVAGPGSTEHVTFSVEVSNHDAGKPVLNSADQVVGIAEPTSQHGAQGVGFAIPIWPACRAVPC
jgi:S1-C subfamily serine protease